MIVSQESEHEFLTSVGRTEPNDKSYNQKIESVLTESRMPQDISDRIKTAKQALFLADLDLAMQGDPYLYALVDKDHALPNPYIPDDLVTLGAKDKSYTVSRNNLSLRRIAEEALEEMASGASLDGVILQASSTYRSYQYQVEVYSRNVRENGQEVADRESARPGYSQHQLGLVVDFGTISDDYANTAAGRWLLKNAPTYGWTLSFPDGYEAITGYRWECWHYRFTGKPLAEFIGAWFNGIQQYALQFIYVWQNGKLY
ncbi:MAG: M15 family metallopeptidase [Termitinemataceae bacterium]|nr:MAG: M15 family metallopeptidase [Termitinemataceae bacterium]